MLICSPARGCGKTSSARIMARSLNCVEGRHPLRVASAIRAWRWGRAGHLDVTEIDAATHNGVEDMRELRERAFFAPAESRYRVIIIDEAHMISQSGFNALLKIVEEPPEHLIFIFATTEPEKMLATIRSRTHNYPFRLLTPPDMRGLLESVVSGEGCLLRTRFIRWSFVPVVVRRVIRCRSWISCWRGQAGWCDLRACRWGSRNDRRLADRSSRRILSTAGPSRSVHCGG